MFIDFNQSQCAICRCVKKKSFFQSMNCLFFKKKLFKILVICHLTELANVYQHK